MDKNKIYYFIGIKGTGMSSLACILSDMGYKVMGSDVDKWFFTVPPLEKRNIVINSFSEKNIKEDMIVIMGAFFNETNIEIKTVLEKNIVHYQYNEFLGLLTKQYQTIGISGCHGKTTTTTMISHLLNNTIGCNYLIGDGTGHAANRNNLFVIEACEYKKHFLEYKFEYLIITNVELDHVDYYKNIDELIEAYNLVLKNCSKLAIIYGDSEYTKMLKHDNIIYYGLDNANDITAKNICYTKNGVIFDYYFKDEYLLTFNLPIFGEHMLLNALAAITMAYLQQIDLKLIYKVFKSFENPKRRFNELKINDSIIIDDYAHHPTEVKAVIESAKQKYPNKKIVVIFKGHTYSRMKQFYQDFIEEFKHADYTYIADFSAARERPEDYPDITPRLFLNNFKCQYISEKSVTKLLQHQGAVYIFMSPIEMKEMKEALGQLLLVDQKITS